MKRPQRSFLSKAAAATSAILAVSAHVARRMLGRIDLLLDMIFYSEGVLKIFLKF